MSRVLDIARREYLENVRTKAFLIGIVLTPLWMGLVFVVPKLMRGATSEAKPVVIVDATGVLAEPLAERIRAAGGFEVEIETDEDPWKKDAANLSRVDELRIKAGAGQLYAIVLTQAALEKKAKPDRGERASEVIGASRSSDDAFRGPSLAAMVNEVVNMQIAEREGIGNDILERLARPAVTYVPVDERGEEGAPTSAILPYLFIMLLFMGIVGISQMLVSSTLEEKSNRVYEVLLSSVSPHQLMTGKIFGICGVGFTLLVVWSGGGVLASMLGGAGDLVSGRQIGLLLAYYVLGFLMIASLMVAVGSACNTLKEAQNLMAPISALLALPIFLAMIVLRDPNGQLATVLSFIPPFTPFLMMARVASVPEPPMWQIPASLALLAVSTWIAMRVAARVFRTGVLLYGQPPSLKEIWRWMRTRN
ncbi:MAG: ABC transporter permease [Planctomycetota bacterium]